MAEDLANVAVTDDDDPDAPWFFTPATSFLEKMKAEFPLRELRGVDDIKLAISTRLRWLREHPEGSVIGRWGLLEAGYFNEVSELTCAAIERLRAERSGATLQELARLEVEGGCGV